MAIASLEPVTKTKYKVLLDGQFAFVLYKGELARYGIREGTEVDDTTVAQIMEEVILKRTKLRAMHLLEDMDRTEFSLRDKLKQGFYPSSAIDAAISYVKSFGYLDDARYARQFVESRIESKSKREIFAILCKKGVSKELIDVALEVYEDMEKEQEAIQRLIQKKRVNILEATPEELHKLYGYLARKGFGYEDIRQVIEKMR